MPRSEAFELAVTNWVDRLGNVFDRIQHCNVRIDRPHQHDHASQFQIRLEIGIPGEEIVVSHHGTDADPYVALAEAFTSGRRRLIDRVRIRRGEVKAHGGAQDSRIRASELLPAVGMHSAIATEKERKS